jgi:transcriptional regulator with XRE-family HTH domain
MEVLGKRLKWLRNKERYSQKEMADLIGMTASGYQKIENSERDPKLDVVIKLCDIFNVSADFLLGRNNMNKELSKVSRELNVIDAQMDKLQYESSLLLIKIHELREELLEVAKSEGFESPKTVSISTKLDAFINQNAETLANIDELEADKSNIVGKYLFTLLDIPESNPLEDDLLGEYLPITTDIQPNIFGEYNLNVHCRGLGLVGTYKFFNSEEEAIKEKGLLIEKINKK